MLPSQSIEQPHLDAGAGALAQRLREHLADLVFVKDVGFEMDPVLG